MSFLLIKNQSVYEVVLVFEIFFRKKEEIENFQRYIVVVTAYFLFECLGILSFCFLLSFDVELVNVAQSLLEFIRKFIYDQQKFCVLDYSLKYPNVINQRKKSNK